ncbi:mediator of RNA polymerase II transcription subunit 15a [Triticum aestivum]|uniref:mediator of RNA polymerase II transcription subunit 15a n=1 Tax=Triticum aestivum TaxID=4565 RepID=UPI001D00C07A|nr:mediator of RNA polymerase II transcription subunit 15a-like [Triticum aestivum]
MSDALVYVTTHKLAFKPVYAAFLDFIAQTGHADGADDWQEDTCEMIKRLKDQYFAELSDLYSHVSGNLNVVDNIIPRQEPLEQYDWMRNFKIMLEHILQVLQMSKNSIQLEPALRNEVCQYEKRIIKMRMLKVYVPQQQLLTQQPHQVQKLQQWSLTPSHQVQKVQKLQPHLIHTAQMQPNNPQQHHLMMQQQQQRPLTQSTQMQANIQHQRSMMSSTQMARILACREAQVQQLFQWQPSQM